MSDVAVRFETVGPRATAVVAQPTTWDEFPSLWARLLDGTIGPMSRWGSWCHGRFEPQGRVIGSELPGGEVAVATHHGDYTRLGVTHDAVRDHAAARGRELAGPRWEIYGHGGGDPSELETGVFWLLG